MVAPEHATIESAHPAQPPPAIVPPPENASVTVLRWCLAILFLFSGVAKLLGAEMMVQTFAHFGYSLGFMYLIGILETAGAIGLMIPGLAIWAALGLCGIMFGAVISHLMFDPFYMALPALIVLALLAVIAKPRARTFRRRREVTELETDRERRAHTREPTHADLRR